uniref:Ig-like domain-containing protein n=1 Tax=Denticeps clupeoides TaxID=299321 RepID=A0AAY4CY33_9TELE
MRAKVRESKTMNRHNRPHLRSFLFTAPETFSLKVPTEPITVQSGSSVVLPCQVSPSFSVDDLGVSWYRPEAVNSPVLHYENRGIQEKASDPRYRGRATLTGDLAKGSVDLALENLTVADNGIYVCYVSSKTWYESAEVTLNIRSMFILPLHGTCSEGSCALTLLHHCVALLASLGSTDLIFLNICLNNLNE